MKIEVTREKIDAIRDLGQRISLLLCELPEGYDIILVACCLEAAGAGYDMTESEIDDAIAQVRALHGTRKGSQ